MIIWTRLKKIYQEYHKFILDIIFPIKCLSCQLEGDWLCSRCLTKIKLYNYHLCPICQLENKDGSVCGYCKKISHLDGLLVVLEKSELTQKIIHFVKYNFIVDIFTYLKPKFVEHYILNPEFRDFFILVPVPLHHRRFLERGFNQSSIICDLIKDTKGNRINLKLLNKVRYNHRQVGLNASSRHLNIINSFKVDKNHQENYHNPILIVDDVYTTGATMEECAKALKDAGFQKVWGLVLVRG